MNHHAIIVMNRLTGRQCIIIIKAYQLSYLRSPSSFPL